MTSFIPTERDCRPELAGNALNTSQPIVTTKRVTMTLTSSTKPDAAAKRYSASSSRVFPLDDDPVVQDPTTSVTSSKKALTLDVRTAFERNNHSEDRVVVLLRRLFFGIILGISVLAIVFGALSKSFVAEGVRSALSIRAFGDRIVFEQVCV